METCPLNNAISSAYGACEGPREKVIGYTGSGMLWAPCEKHLKEYVGAAGWNIFPVEAPKTKKRGATGKKGRKKVSERSYPWYEALPLALESGTTRLALLGPPGTGKSRTSVEVTGTRWRITMTEGTGIEDLIGMYQLRNGETIWIDGPAICAMKEGAGLIIDEIDHHPAEVGSLLYAILDDAPQIMLPTGEMVVAKDGYKVLCTSNANIATLPEAIVDRMEAVLVAKTPHPKAMEDMGESEKACVVNYFRGVSDSPWKWGAKPTLRRMRSFERIRKAKKLCETQAADMVFGSAGKEILSALATASRPY